MRLVLSTVVGLVLQVSAPVASAQAPSSDSLAVVTLERFTAQVSAHHPVIRQARLGVQQAREEERVARGAFDPMLTAAWDRKTFGTVAYYDYMTAALSVPTPLGVDVKLGFERTGGVYASPDRRTPARGLLTAGVAIPLGQRMLTDERRTALVVARSLRDGAAADRDGTVNRVLLAATRDYARWFEAERRLAIANEGVTVAEFRRAAVRRRVADGEAAALDTMEAALEVLRRDVQRVEASQARFAARLAVEAYLWDARGLPDSLPASATPVVEHDAPLPSGPAATDVLVATAQRLHPDVQRVAARIEQATAAQRLASQQRLPYIAAELSALGDAADRLPVASTLDDAKVGLAFRSPLLLLRERGRANAAELRVDQAALERDRTRRDVGVVVRTAAAEVDAVTQAVALQRAVVAHARALVQGERLRFDAGESTLFLVNTRERGLLDEELRLASIIARGIIADGELAAATGAWLPRAPEIR